MNKETAKNAKLTKDMERQLKSYESMTKDNSNQPFTELLLDPTKGGSPGAQGKSQKWSSSAALLQEESLNSNR